MKREERRRFDVFHHSLVLWSSNFSWTAQKPLVEVICLRSGLQAGGRSERGGGCCGGHCWLISAVSISHDHHHDQCILHLKELFDFPPHHIYCHSVD